MSGPLFNLGLFASPMEFEIKSKNVQQVRQLARAAAASVVESRNMAGQVQKLEGTIGVLSGTEHVYADYLCIAIDDPEYYESATALMDEIDFSQIGLFDAVYDHVIYGNLDAVEFMLDRLSPNTKSELCRYTQDSDMIMLLSGTRGGAPSFQCPP